MFLNLWRHNTYSKYSQQLHAYINELLDFAQYYLRTRYSMNVKASAYWPYLIPKSYDEVRRIDVMFDGGFGKHLQMYVGYGIDFKDIHGKDAAGYAECRTPKLLLPGDMMFAEMSAYHGQMAFVPTIYAYYAEFSRIFFHEIDHQVMRLLGDKRYITGVHTAAKMPTMFLQKSAVGYNWVVPVLAQNVSNRKIPYFVIQQDPRQVGV